jgi:hypothetical protein
MHRPPPALPQLPRGGRRIFPSYRVVSYYGAAGLPILGVLGTSDPDSIATQVAAQANGYAAWGRRIQPAFELIATMAQPCGADFPACTGPVSDQTIQQYLDTAHRHKMLLILDIQPGRQDFLPQLKRLESFLLDPSVEVALDPEWKLTADEYPIRNIGESSAASVNAVGRYLSTLVTTHQLPDKLLLIHQFLEEMLPDRQNITQHPGVEAVLHADGFGDALTKITVYHRLGFPVPPFHSGLKLFFTRDYGLLSPGQVMALKPQPELISYQ